MKLWFTGSSVHIYLIRNIDDLELTENTAIFSTVSAEMFAKEVAIIDQDAVKAATAKLLTW